MTWLQKRKTLNIHRTFTILFGLRTLVVLYLLSMKRARTYYGISAVILFTVVLFSSCANIIPPGGGPRDSLPPKLVAALPKDSATNVTPKIITLTFDEYVTLQGIQENLIVSPTVVNTPLVDSKLRNITIKLRDTLDANTTYSLNFGDAVKDVNEGNTAKGFTYVFSTGSKIDQNDYHGRVIMAETGKIDSTLIVILHKNLADSAIVTLRPRYYTRLNGKGEFSFHFLPAGNFNVYVLRNDFTKKYDDSTRVFAFRSNPVAIGENTPTDTLFAYQEVKSAPPRTSSNVVKLPGANRGEDKRLRYSSNVDNGQDLLTDLSLTFNRKIFRFDSTKFVLSDTNYHKLTGYVFLLDSTRTKVWLKYPWKENTPLRILIAKDAIADSTGTALAKTDTLRFYTKKEADYGSVRLRFTNIDLSNNPVLQIVLNNVLLESIPLTGNEFRRKLFAPGTYDLRILFDRNRNGIWDPGHFFGKKRQPEIVQLIPKQLVIRPNWDNEVNIVL